MKHLLDTDALSATRRPERNPAVVRFLESQLPYDLGISVVTIEEIETGIVARLRRDPMQGAQLRSWFDRAVLGVFGMTVLPYDLAAARTTARLGVLDPFLRNDARIAGIALANNLTIVTGNTRHFEPFGVRTLDPWAC